MKIFSEIVAIETENDISIFDVTAQVRATVEKSAVSNGIVLISSRHTTTAITINEYEERLLKDIRKFFQQLVPKTNKYLHNDIAMRVCPPDEPENAHSHLSAILFGNSEAVSLIDKQLGLGTYQSILLVELDGPRHRSVNVQVMGE